MTVGLAAGVDPAVVVGVALVAVVGSSPPVSRVISAASARACAVRSAAMAVSVATSGGRAARAASPASRLSALARSN